MIKVKLKILFIVLILFMFSSCRFLYFINYDKDNGKEWKKEGYSTRYTAIKNKHLYIEIRVHEYGRGIEISHLSSINNKKSKNVEIDIISEKLRFKKGAILKSIMDTVPSAYYDSGYKVKEIFTCNKFYKQVRKNRYLYYEVEYKTDSLGIVIYHKEKYKLKRKYYMRNIIHF